MNINMDMADEKVKDIETRSSGEIPGIDVDKQQCSDAEITRVRILNDEGERQIGKPIGSYITVDIKALYHQGPEGAVKAADCIAGELSKLLPKPNKNMTTLVVGLGNYNITSDALGPKAIEKILVTRHVKGLLNDELAQRMHNVCAIAPGVLGSTGIETLEIIRGVCEHVKPGVIIAIDSLASGESCRVGASIQMCDTGISPGAGIGNRRMMLNEDTIGIKTIGLGVPTVVYAQVIGREALQSLIDAFSDQTQKGSHFFSMLNELEDKGFRKLTDELLEKNLGNMIVTPKEIDLIIDRISGITASAINLATQSELRDWEINQMMH